MSKLLFAADFHGNYVATMALDAEIKKIQPDEIFFLGDAIGKGPDNDKTCDWVRANCNHFIKGNWDRMLNYSRIPNGYPMHEFYRNQIGEERFNWLESLPFEDEVLISGLNFRLLHGRPSDLNYHPYLTIEELKKGLWGYGKNCTSVTEDDAGNVTLVGTKRKFDGFIGADCHMPYIQTLPGGGYAINTGSVGNSLGVANCHCLLIEGELGSTEKTPLKMSILSIPYDNEKAALRAKETVDLPDSEAFQKEVLTGVYSR